MTNPLFDTLFGKCLGQSTPFLQMADGGVITHREFLELAAKYAHVFTRLGVTPGDRVAVQVGKSAQALAVYAACVQAGIVFLPLNNGYTADEVAYFVENCAARLILCDDAMFGGLTPVAQANDAVLETLSQDGSGSFALKAKAMPLEFPTVARNRGDLAALLYTSGTTGRSKGAMLTQDNLLSNAQVLVDEWAFTSDDVLLHALPIFHTHGLFVATNIALLAGSKILFVPKFDLDKILDLLPQSTSLMGVPTFYTRLLEDPRFTKDLAQHMRLFISGSAPLLAETHLRFEERTGHRILERYGMTETNMNTSNPYVGERRAGTVGFPLPGVEIKITDSKTGATLPQGDIGDIEVRGPNVFKGYWQMPEKTAEELRDDGFFITGDLGRFDEDGYLHIVGRNKDLIISGGYNIYPKEIELLLDQQDGVLESAVIGVPHPDFGETAVGVLVAEEGAALDLDAIQKSVTSALARFKHPKKLVALKELPRNTMGKVQKKALRDQFNDLFASA
ncbi:MAG: malonyl-CoA synthase [Pseudomonadota bacterium]